MANLGDFLKAINKNKSPIIDEDPLTEKEYIPFVVNRTLSYFPDTVLFANEMNRLPMAERKMQFDYLRHAIRANSRFSKWTKPVVEKRIELIKKVYGYNNQRAREVADLLSDKDFAQLEASMSTGGKA